VEKIKQASYTASMKKVMMRDFRWLGKPEIWNKDYKETTLVVGPGTELPSCPLLLAVSDEDFDCNLTISLAPQGGEAGVCIYHSDLSYSAVGLSTDTLFVHTSVRGYTTTSQVPVALDQTPILWKVERDGETVILSYACDLEKSSFIQVSSTSLPGMQRAISFGPYFANGTLKPFEAEFHSVRYAKKAGQ
jgi:regulation of enolase protein 1 (concanavalin A-like superfamily)